MSCPSTTNIAEPGGSDSETDGTSKMSVCGEFAEHVWKPGSCKNCFHPRSAHPPSTHAPYSRSYSIGSEDDTFSFTPSHSKPTIAVRPTMMNMEMIDVNMNTEQDTQKTPVDRCGLTKLLDVSPILDNNGVGKALKEAALQNSISGKLDFPALFSPTNISPFSLHKELVTGVFVTQEEGGTVINPTYQSHVGHLNKSTYMGNGSHHPKLGVRTRSSGNSDGYSEVPVYSPSAQGEREHIDITFSVIAPTPTKTANIRSVELLSTSSNLVPECGLHVPHQSYLSDPTSLSDSCSYRSSTDSLTGFQGADVFRQSSSESPCTFSPSAKPLADSGNWKPSAEPIYAEITKRKRSPLGSGQSQQSLGQEVELNGESQRAKITVMAAHTEENNRTFYLSSPDSAVSTEWPNFSPNSCKDPSSPAFMWPSGCTSSEMATSSIQVKPQASPPVPPKRGSRSPKLGTSSLTTLSETQTEEKSQGDIALLERRRKLCHTPWNWKARIEEEEEEEDKIIGNTPHNAINGPINGAAVCSPVALSEESFPPGTANNGASEEQLGSAASSDTCTGDMLSQATAESLTADLSEGSAESYDPTPPPPPPKKHNRSFSKMSQCSLDPERTSLQGSVESLTHSLRALASSDSLHRESRLFNDGGYHSTPPVGSPVNSPPPSPLPETAPPPPPLPEKKMLNRAVSAPGGKPGSPARPRLLLAGSENDVCRGSRSTSPAEQRGLYSSSESLEGCHPPLSRSLRSRTLDETPARGRPRLGGGCLLRGGVASSSSPQLNVPGSGLPLHGLLSNMESREAVYTKLGGLYAESLRRLALRCEELFTRSQRNPLHFDESNWSLFKLTSNKPCCDAGDAVYYSASCASDPVNTYAVKICKSRTTEAKQAEAHGLSVQQSVPPHFNLQQDSGHFLACVPPSMLPPEEEDEPGGRCEAERVVVITREVPLQSAAAFVRERAAQHRTRPEDYERRVCFLLLQLCQALEHLKEHGVTHRHLCLENLLLVPRGTPGTETDPLPRLLVSNFSKAKRRGGDEKEEGPHRDRARLAPEILSAAQYRKFDEFQMGILVYELLHQPNPFEMSPRLKERDYACEDLPPIPTLSIYSPGLQRLAHLLLQPDPTKRLHVYEAKRALQCLLWGPRRDLMEWDGGVVSGALPNWLDVKRALLMMKFAERSLEPGRGVELEDWLCCQYFAGTHPRALVHTAELLYFSK